MLTHEYVKRLFDYDPATGLLRWKVSRPKLARIGSLAGDTRSKGYSVVRIDGSPYMIHIIWLWMTCELPNQTIDHADKNPRNNRWANLRQATRSQQQMNRGVQANNRSGHTGVHWEKRRQKWLAKIYIGRRFIHLGSFNSLTEAVKCRAHYARIYHGTFSGHEVMLSGRLSLRKPWLSQQ
jgi:hypothetical protein